ncbi:hypothetical protein GGS24DRAFT_454662 [Hypoxylon argillaceum]|nr:hypothetical protein GGS24DRAFT_454662 [Hypoxylon argillaceum]
MAQYYEACGDKDSQRRNLILKSKLWAGNQHIPQDNLYRGHFMRAGSYMLPSCKIASQF